MKEEQCPCGRTDAHEHESDKALDRTGWKAGPWDGEPDYLHWVDEQTDLDCLIVRANELGHLCGYVGVPKGHSWHGIGYMKIPEYPGSVHGGLTYSDHCQGRVCHHVEGRPEPMWWLGFDCGHSCDHSPGEAAIFKMAASMRGTGGTYRNVQYVKDHCRNFCDVVFTAKADERKSEL
jgi:hypothetical protein